MVQRRAVQWLEQTNAGRSREMQCQAVHATQNVVGMVMESQCHATCPHCDKRCYAVKIAV